MSLRHINHHKVTHMPMSPIFQLNHTSPVHLSEYEFQSFHLNRFSHDLFVARSSNSSSKVDSPNIILKKGDESLSKIEGKSTASDLDEKSIDELFPPSNHTSDDDKIRTQCTQASISRCGIMLIRTLEFLRFAPANRVSVLKCSLRTVSLAILLLVN